MYRRRGAANFFCVKDGVLYTPELTGTILPGITRDSIIQLARHDGIEVHETKVTAEFAMSADEAFVVVLQQLSRRLARLLKAMSKPLMAMKAGPMTEKLYNQLVGIQNETEEDILRLAARSTA